MADNTMLNPTTALGGDVIATDEVTLMNGVVSSGIKVQRVKTCFGDDAEARDVSNAYPLPVKFPVATKLVTATDAINTALTLTLPAPAAGLFIYLLSLQVTKLYGVVGIADGAGVLITSTNLPGSPIWTTEQIDLTAGYAPKVVDDKFTAPLKASAAATPVTIICPQQLQTIWRVTATYYEAL